MMAFTKCPVCGGELETKAVEKIVRSGKHTVILNVGLQSLPNLLDFYDSILNTGTDCGFYHPTPFGRGF